MLSSATHANSRAACGSPHETAAEERFCSTQFVLSLSRRSMIVYYFYFHTMIVIGGRYGQLWEFIYFCFDFVWRFQCFCFLLILTVKWGINCIVIRIDFNSDLTGEHDLFIGGCCYVLVVLVERRHLFALVSLAFELQRSYLYEWRLVKLDKEIF